MWRTTRATILAHRRRLLATCSAVLLAVALLTGTLVLGNTVTDGFDRILTRAYAGTDAVVRSSELVGVGDFPERRLVDRSLAGTLAGVDGVDAVAPRIEATGQITGADGDPVGGAGATIAGNWIEDGRLNPYELAEGRAPAAPGEVVIDRGSAEEGGLAVGATTVVRVPEPVTVTIVGLATFGGADRQGSATYAGFTTEFAERVLLPEPGRTSSIAVAAEPGLSQPELVSRLDAVLPDGLEALTGAAHTRELARRIQGDDNQTLQQALLAFTVVSLVVATFSIYHTFSIVVAQRTREAALLRAVGASRGQVLRSVAAEALVVGLAGSASGIFAGWGLAAGLLAVMDAAGLPVPAGTPVLEPATVATALGVGVAATLLASIAPAVRAARVPPLAALREVAADRSTSSRARVVTGAMLTGAGVALAIAGATGDVLPATGAGAVATLTGVVLLGPVIARAAAAGLVTPGAGASGVLARRNAARNPRRTAGTAVSLMIGAAVVVLFTVVAGSLQQSIAGAVDRQFAGDLVISGEGRGGLSTELAAALDALPEVAAASPIGGARVRVDGTDALATTIDPATIEAVVDLEVRQGSVRALGPDQLAVSADYAERHRLGLGDRLAVVYPDGVTQRPAVGAIYAGDNLVGTGGIALHRDAYLPHTTRRVDVTVLIALAAGVPEAAGEAAVQRVADRFGAPDVQTNREFTDAIAAEINGLLTVVYLLLTIAIVIAVTGIANTLSLSVHERTREVGLLRAVGQTRRQTRTMVRYEALIVALSGTVTGLALGLFLGWALLPVLAVDGFTASFALPLAPLAVVLGLGVLVGVLAAARPARRAARTDVLAAIATE